MSVIAADVSKQPLIPSKHIADVTTNDIVQGYFGDTIGLGPLFLAAVEDYYSYKVCDNPSCPSSKFTLVTASGSKTKATMYDPDCDFYIFGGIVGSANVGSDKKGVFCDDSCPNAYTNTLCYDGVVANCPNQSICHSGKTFLNPEYISQNPGLVEMPQCQTLFATVPFPNIAFNTANMRGYYENYCK